jgi:hypothetical protein
MCEKVNIANELKSQLTKGNPYETIDIKELPEWWERNIRLFNEYKMKTYLPPLLKDGTVVPSLRRSIESKHDVDIEIQSLDPKSAASWGVYVDGNYASSVERYRSTSGQVIYNINKDEFKSMVSNTLSAERQ